MVEYLSDKELQVIKMIKEDYDKKLTNPLTTIEPIFDIEVTENVPDLLQEKGYIEITKSNLGDNMEIVSILLKDKLFELFNKL